MSVCNRSMVKIYGLTHTLCMFLARAGRGAIVTKNIT